MRPARLLGIWVPGCGEENENCPDPDSSGQEGRLIGHASCYPASAGSGNRRLSPCGDGTTPGARPPCDLASSKRASASPSRPTRTRGPLRSRYLRSDRGLAILCGAKTARAFDEHAQRCQAHALRGLRGGGHPPGGAVYLLVSDRSIDTVEEPHGAPAHVDSPIIPRPRPFASIGSVPGSGTADGSDSGLAGVTCNFLRQGGHYP
jgi:hypothetical protein